jgi:PAS domain S-box-containing protein
MKEGPVLPNSKADAFLVIDPETGHILEASAHACALLDAPKEVLCTKQFDELVLAEVHLSGQGSGPMQATGSFLPFRLANGTLVLLECQSTPLEYQDRVLTVVHLKQTPPLLHLLHAQDFLGFFGIQNGRLFYANAHFATLLGYEHPESLWGKAIDELLSPDTLPVLGRSDQPPVFHTTLKLCRHQAYLLEAKAIVARDVDRFWVLLYPSVDLQARFHAHESRILEGLVCGEPQEKLLDALCYALESRIPGGTCTVLLLREGRLYRGASHMPPEYDAAIEGIVIGPEVGSCGTAAFFREPVWVSDVLRDNRWIAYRSLANAFGFRACWSYPILDRQGRVLGTFAIYFSEPRGPSPEEQVALARSANLAALILETSRLQQERELLAQVARQTTNGVIITDVQRHVIWANEGFTRLTGYTLEEVRGQSLLGFLHGPQTNPQTVAEIRRCLLAQIPVRTRIYNYRKDGTGFWNNLSIDPLWHADGTLAGYIGIENDISELVAREQELERARAEAEAAARLKSAFLANLSHEIRTPLNSILGFTDLLDEALAAHQLEALREFTSIIRRSGRRLLQLINDILELSRLEADRLILAQEPCHLEALVQEALAELRPLALRKNLQLKAQIAPVPPIRGDARRLHQVLINLIGNAIKYTDQGEVCVALTTNPSPPPQVVLRVVDTGRGIAPESLPYIFEPFWQAPAEARRGEGSGLGLAITKRLIEQMGGQITVDSTPGRGTTFTVTFPVLLLADAKS